MKIVKGFDYKEKPDTYSVKEAVEAQIADADSYESGRLENLAYRQEAIARLLGLLVETLHARGLLETQALQAMLTAFDVTP